MPSLENGLTYEIQSYCGIIVWFQAMAVFGFTCSKSVQAKAESVFCVAYHRPIRLVSVNLK